MPPIALKSFHIKNYKGIVETQIEDIPTETQWIFLTGENGFGKTLMLQALADGFNPSPYLQENKVVYSHNHILFENGKPIDGSDSTSFKKAIIGYGSARLLNRSDAKVLTEYGEYSSLFSSSAFLYNVEHLFKEWYKEYPEGKERFENLFKAFLPNLHSINVEFSQANKLLEVKYYEKDELGNAYSKGIEFNDLAAGYRNIIGMIGNMVFRLALKQDVDAYSDLEGIVIIDEIELHLHPKYQKLFVEKLTELFPKIQFIVSTHSPIPLLGAPHNTVILNVTRTEEEGITVSRLYVDFSVLTPNAILSSPIFGFQDLIPDSKPKDVMIRTEDTFTEVEFNNQVKKNINAFLTKEKQEELLKIIKAS